MYSILIDSSGLTLTSRKDILTFAWNTLLITLHSAKYERSFFTLLHYWAFAFGQRFKKSQDETFGLFTNTAGDITTYDVVASVIAQDKEWGAKNFVVLLNTPETLSFLSMLKDYKYVDGNSLVSVLRTTKEGVTPLVEALYKVDAHILEVVTE